MVLPGKGSLIVLITFTQNIGLVELLRMHGLLQKPVLQMTHSSSIKDYIPLDLILLSDFSWNRLKSLGLVGLTH